MRCLKLTVAYDGTDFCGWQAQPEGRSVQVTLESAIRSVTGERHRVMASGRTDAGVHAIGQVVSVSTDSRLDAKTFRRALNANLPPDVRVRDVEDATADFHAVRDAQSKRYRYVIQNGGVVDPFRRRFCWSLPQPLELDTMRLASRHLVGQHDFASFQSSGSPRKTTVRNVHELKLVAEDSEFAPIICLEIEANGFLYNMVRNIVGTLVEVGKGRQPVDWPCDVRAALDRRMAGPKAPPQGLFLVSVVYRPGRQPNQT